jgi:hypothetical protein
MIYAIIIVGVSVASVFITLYIVIKGYRELDKA